MVEIAQFIRRAQKEMNTMEPPSGFILIQYSSKPYGFEFSASNIPFKICIYILGLVGRKPKNNISF